MQFVIRREAAELLLGEAKRAVDDDFKGAAAALDQLDVHTFVGEPLPRTEGRRLIVSLHAVFDADVHEDVLFFSDGRSLPYPIGHEQAAEDPPFLYISLPLGQLTATGAS